MKLFVRYVYQHLPLLLLTVSSLLLQSLCYSLYGIDMEIILYTEGLVLCVLCIYAMVRFFTVRKTYTALQRIHDGESAAITEYPETIDVIEKEEYRIIQLLIQDSKQKSMDSKEKYDAMMDYYTVWAHQIKTPIAALNILLQEEEQDIAACRQELFKIESYVEMALNYLRFEEMSNDLVLERNSLEQLVRQVVRKYATIFIYNHISIQLEHLDYTVLTDEKWFCFMLEQILSNALKYTKQGSVKIYAEETENGLHIFVKDTGIGIKREDLPRIFEKGFTGYNGRMDKKASGLGLYLCKGVCGKLGHEISVSSKEGEGTTVTLTLQCEKVQQRDLVNM